MNNLKAPRYRKQIKTTLEDDFFNFLFEKNPELKYKYSEREIKKIIIKFNEKLADSVISNRDGVELPVLSRVMMMVSYFPNSKEEVLDYNTFNKTKGEIRKTMLNQHTNGLMLKILFRQHLKKIRRIALKFYAFTPERSVSRKFSAAFRQNYKFYQQVDYKSTKEIEIITKLDPDTYNEFEL